MTPIVFWSMLNLTYTLFCKQVSNLAFLIVSYFFFTLFCIQVTSLAFFIELDLIFTFFCMQVVIMVFCTDLDFILNLFCMKVTSLAFWREWDLIIHHPLLLVLQQLRYSDTSNPRMNNNCRCNISPFYLPWIKERVSASNFCLQVYRLTLKT